MFVLSSLLAPSLSVALTWFFTPLDLKIRQYLCRVAARVGFDSSCTQSLDQIGAFLLPRRLCSFKVFPIDFDAWYANQIRKQKVLVKVSSGIFLQ